MPVLLKEAHRPLQKSQGEVDALLQSHMQVMAENIISDLG